MIQIFEQNEIRPEDILHRDNAASGVEAAVSEILNSVRRGGDAAVLACCEKFDGAAPERLKVTPEEMDAALASVDSSFIAVLEEAAANIRDFHRRQKRESFVIAEKPGRVLGQKLMPLSRVGLYVPGGTACYPSTVLMNCIPAKIAGVQEICICTPAKNGTIRPEILAAAKIAAMMHIWIMSLRNAPNDAADDARNTAPIIDVSSVPAYSSGTPTTYWFSAYRPPSFVMLE